MLDVIWSRGLPLDRITTTDVWATDTISANLPPMEAFKGRMDQWIWDRYRIEVEHLCARNPDGSKKTYEQMFYHVPKRRSQVVQAERERENRFGGETIRGFPDLWNPWCQSDLKNRGYREQGSITGFPPNTGYNWCQKLKIVQDQRVSGPDFPVVQKTQDRQSRNSSFLMAPARGAGKEISWNIWELPLTSRNGLAS